MTSLKKNFLITGLSGVGKTNSSILLLGCRSAVPITAKEGMESIMLKMINEIGLASAE